MTYFMSDIHGEYRLFLFLMGKIGFSEKDTLYICGDIIEKGPDSVRLAKELQAHNNIHVVRGNHEDDFVRYYRHLMEESDGKDHYVSVLEELRNYLGGEDGQLLDWETVDWLENLPFYIETEDFLCVHAGVPLDDNGRIPPLDTIMEEEFLYNRRFKSPDVLPVDEKCVFYGHTSSMSVFPDARIVEYTRGEDRPTSIHDYIKVHLDTGTFTSGVLGCFCLDTCQSFFVSKHELSSQKRIEEKNRIGSPKDQE